MSKIHSPSIISSLITLSVLIVSIPFAVAEFVDLAIPIHPVDRANPNQEQQPKAEQLGPTHRKLAISGDRMSIVPLVNFWCLR